MNGRLRFPHLSLKWKAFVIFMMIVSLPTSILGAVVLVQTNQMLKRQAVDSAARVLDILSQDITSIVENVQDISSYMIYDIQFRKYLSFRPEDGETQEDFLSLQDSIHAFSAFQVISKRYLDSIELEGVNGRAALTFGDMVVGDESNWERIAELAQGAYIWSSAYPMKGSSGEEKMVISLFRQIKDINQINKTLGLVRIRLSEREIYSLISSKGFARTAGTVYMVDNYGKIIAHRDRTAIGGNEQDEELLKQINMNKNLISFSNKSDKYVVVAQKIPSTDWYLVAKVDEWEIVKNLDPIQTSIKVMIVFSTLMGLMALIGFYWFLIRPIVALTEFTKQVEKGHFDMQAPVESHDEIGRLGLHFNKMVRTIQRLIETKYKLEIQHKESELKALQNQIDPHFLYNTLDAIHWTARMEQAMETSTLIVALSKLFRNSLSNGKLYIPLSRELEYVNNYLILQKKRVRFELQAAIECEKQLDQVLVPKKIIQPLVENSIVHGFHKSQDAGFIQIRCTTLQGCLYIDVIDNGKGFQPSMMASAIMEEHAESGFALRNIQQRITMLFGEEFGLSFIQAEGGGAHVRIILPLVHTEQEMKAFIGKGNDDQ